MKIWNHRDQQWEEAIYWMLYCPDYWIHPTNRDLIEHAEEERKKKLKEKHEG